MEHEIVDFRRRSSVFGPPAGNCCIYLLSLTHSVTLSILKKKIIGVYLIKSSNYLSNLRGFQFFLFF